MINGTDIENTWAIVFTACGPFVGKASKPYPMAGNQVRLESAFEFKLIQVQTPQGPAMQRRLVPVLFFSSELTMELTAIGTVWVRDMNATDQSELMKLVDIVRHDMDAMRAAQAGITLATQMPGNQRS